MSEKYDHEMPHHDPSEGFDDTEPAAREITFFVVVSVLTLVVVIGALQFYFNGVWDTMVDEKVLTAPGLAVQDQRDLEAWRLSHYEYTTPAKDTVRIPFERAKQLFLQEAAEGKTFYPALSTVPKPDEPETPAESANEAAAPGTNPQESKQ